MYGKLIAYGLIISLGLSNTTRCFEINRVILSSDANPFYLQFWPLVAKAWKKIIGIQPTLILVAGNDVKVNEKVGDVIRFEPIPNIPTSFQAQIIRLVAPAYFENDFCIISDVDMLPLSKHYFINSAKKACDDCFVVYRNNAYKGEIRYAMCYNAARGSTFKEVFNIKSTDEIKEKIIEWYALGWGWCTDEFVLTKTLLAWPEHYTRLTKLGHRVTRRIDRLNWTYDKKSLKRGVYIDAHMLRPYEEHRQQINELAGLFHIRGKLFNDNKHEPIMSLLPLLGRLVYQTSGDILEITNDSYLIPFLHVLCDHRKLTTLTDTKTYQKLATQSHTIVYDITEVPKSHYAIVCITEPIKQEYLQQLRSHVDMVIFLTTRYNNEPYFASFPYRYDDSFCTIVSDTINIKNFFQ